MGTQALRRRLLHSPPRRREDDNARSAPALRQIRLTPGWVGRAPPRFSWSRGTLGCPRGPIQTTLDRPPRCVRAVYADLSNTR